MKFHTYGKGAMEYQELYLRWLRAKRDYPHLDHSAHKPHWPHHTPRYVRQKLEEETEKEFARST